MSVLTLPKIAEFAAGLLARGSDVLANDQAVANFLNGPNIDQSNLNLAMTPIWTGVHSFTNDLRLASLKKLYFDGGSDTYITESAANVLDFVVGGATTVKVNGSSDVRLNNVDLWLTSLKKLFFDGGGDTYFTESAANVVDIVLGGATVVKMNSSTDFRIQNVDLWLTAAKKLYLDGGADTYITQSSDNVIDFVVGGATTMKINGSTDIQMNNVDLFLTSLKKMYFDGGGDTYIQETSPNFLAIVAGGIQVASFPSGVASSFANGITVGNGNVFGATSTFNHFSAPSNAALELTLSAATAFTFEATQGLRLPDSASYAAGYSNRRDMAKAWGVVNGTTGALLEGRGVTSVGPPTTTGQYLVTLTTPFATTDFMVQVTAKFGMTAIQATLTSYTVSSTSTFIVYTGTANDGGGGGAVAPANQDFSFVCYGRQ